MQAADPCMNCLGSAKQSAFVNQSSLITQYKRLAEATAYVIFDISRPEK